MKILWLILVALATFTKDSSAALALLQRETFQAVRTLDAAHPGDLGTISGDGGSLVCRPVGPRVMNDTSVSGRGWSADLQRSLGVTWSPSTFGSGVLPNSASNDANAFCVDRFLFLGDAPYLGRLTFLGDSHNGAALLSLEVDPNDAMVLVARTNGTTSGSGCRLPLRSWIQLRVAWRQIPGYWNYQASVLIRSPGGAWQEVLTTQYQITSALDVARFGYERTGALPTFNAREGLFSAYHMDAWQDRLGLDAAIVDPPVGPFEWFCNPATGNDANDGTSPQTAWATAAKVTTESANLGMIPSSGYPTGDTLHLDLSGANLVLASTSLFLRTPGLNVLATGSGEIQAWENVSGADWKPVPGTAHVFQHALSGSGSGNTDVVLWQNDCWLNHPIGNVLADVQNALDATPGSFWTDGTTLYLHPFGNTDPAGDGQVYTRSYNRQDGYGNPGQAAVMLCAPSLHLTGLKVGKTCLARRTDNDPVAAYCFQTAENAGGTTLLENCYGYDGSKHVFGFTDNATDRRYTVRACQAEQATPYVSFGGQTAWVDYGGGSVPAGSTGTASTLYDGCVTLANSGQIGSAAGKVESAYPVWISHGDGPVYSGITFNDCRWAGGSLVSYGGIASLVVQGGQMPSGNFSGGSVLYSGCLVEGPPPTSADVGTSVLVRNCWLTPPTLGGNPPTLAGGVSVVGCTVDCRAVAAPGPFYRRSDALTFLWRDNLLLGAGCPVIDGATGTDTLTFDHNAYTDPGAVLSSYHDGSTTADLSFALWQSLGHETGSFVTTNPALDANGFPAASSPLTDAGADLGALADFTGRRFADRRTVGALEPLSTFARWQAVNFTAAEQTQPALSAPTADPDADGVSNLLEYALGTNPRQGNPSAVFLGFQAIDGQTYQTLTYPQQEEAADLTYTPQVSADLVHWTGGTAALVQVSHLDLGDGFALVTVRDTQPLTLAPRRFLRLQVSTAAH